MRVPSSSVAIPLRNTIRSPVDCCFVFLGWLGWVVVRCSSAAPRELGTSEETRAVQLEIDFFFQLSFRLAILGHFSSHSIALLLFIPGTFHCHRVSIFPNSCSSFARSLSLSLGRTHCKQGCEFYHLVSTCAQGPTVNVVVVLAKDLG